MSSPWPVLNRPAVIDAQTLTDIPHMCFAWPVPCYVECLELSGDTQGRVIEISRDASERISNGCLVCAGVDGSCDVWMGHVMCGFCHKHETGVCDLHRVIACLSCGWLKKYLDCFITLVLAQVWAVWSKLPESRDHFVF